jgi:YfiH family protein
MFKKNGIDYIKKTGCGFEIAFLTRKGGFSAHPYDSLNMSYHCGDDKDSVDKNYEKFFTAFGIKRDKLVRLNQVHGSDVLVIKRNDTKQKRSGDYDAAITDDTDLCLSIATADCVPIFLFDGDNKVFAAVHAGWMGTALGIVKKVVNVMGQEFMCDTADINAALGPAIKECCYEIGADVLDKLLDSVSAKETGLHKETNGKIYASLSKFNAIQLKQSGIKEEKISIADHCTCCERELFFSYRRENITGRQLSVIFGD